MKFIQLVSATRIQIQVPRTAEQLSHERMETLTSWLLLVMHASEKISMAPVQGMAATKDDTRKRTEQHYNETAAATAAAVISAAQSLQLDSQHGTQFPITS